MPTPTYEMVKTYTVPSATTSVTLSTISGAYTDLVLIVSAGATSSGQGLTYQLNSDTGSNYSVTALRGNGSAATSFRQSNNDRIPISNFSEPPTSGVGTYIVNFMNYSNTTTYKSSLSRGNSASFGVDAFAGLWRSTAAITSIKINISGGNITAGSTFNLYGIKAA